MNDQGGADVISSCKRWQDHNKQVRAGHVTQRSQQRPA